MEKNFDITKPRYSEQILPVPWPFVISRFHSVGECSRDQYYWDTFVLLGGDILSTGPQKGHCDSVHTWCPCMVMEYGTRWALV